MINNNSNHGGDCCSDISGNAFGGSDSKSADENGAGSSGKRLSLVYGNAVAAVVLKVVQSEHYWSEIWCVLERSLTHALKWWQLACELTC